MSEAVERFVADVKSNPEFENRLKNAMGIPAIVKVADELGYKISEAELRDYTLGHDGELTDEEIDGVVGGLTWGLQDKFP